MALLHHSGIYFLARILAGSAAFAILAAFTRLLDPHAFGELALSVSGVAFFAVLVVEWSMLAMLRYLPGHSAVARATTLWGLILPAVAVCGMARVAFLLAAPERWRVQLALCAGLLIAILLHQFQLAAAQGALRPGKYALLGSFESVLNMVLDISLVLLGVGFAIAAMKMGRVFPFPLPDSTILAAGLLGVAAMAAWLLPFYHATAWSAALYVIPVAILIYFGFVFLVLHLFRRKPLELMRGLWNGQASTDTSAR